MRTRAERKFVAKATALGARVPLAELFVLSESVFLTEKIDIPSRVR